MERASANILEKPRIRTTLGERAPPAAPATIAKEVRIPSSPPKIRGLRSPPSVLCGSLLSSLSLWRLSWNFLYLLLVYLLSVQERITLMLLYLHLHRLSLPHRL